MIFVTVGTHEQPFDRLIKEIDRLKGEGIIREEVVIQTGYSTYEPKYCTWFKLLPYDQMEQYVKDADIIITHGGPSSFMMPLQMGKKPIVVPRKQQFDEHVNDHQVDFVKAVAEKQNNIIVVDDVTKLKDVLLNYKTLIKNRNIKLRNNNIEFNKRLNEITSKMFKGKL